MTALARTRSALEDCYRFREVFANLLSQNLKVKYKRTLLGYFWSLLNPMLQLVVLSAVFSHVMKSGLAHYPLYLFSGMLAWTFLSSSVVVSSTALLENEAFIKKVYLPKLLFPLSKVCLQIIDFGFALVALGVIMAVLGYPFRATVLLVPMAICILFFMGLGLSLIVSVATVYFRDVQYLLGVFLQLLYFATPILYPLTALPERYKTLMKFNPFYPSILLFQKLIYYGEIPTLGEWASAVSVACIFMLVGMGTLLVYDEELAFRM